MIQEHDLVAKTGQVGDRIHKSLLDLAQGAGKGKMSAVRGQGTFIAFDMDSPAQRDSFVSKMRSKGINMGASVSSAKLLLLSMTKADAVIKVCDYAQC